MAAKRLRALRFDSPTPEGDVACRALLAAFALNGLARSDAELLLRANCDLVEAGPAVVTLDKRYGQKESFEPLSIDQAQDLLSTDLARTGQPHHPGRHDGGLSRACSGDNHLGFQG